MRGSWRYFGILGVAAGCASARSSAQDKPDAKVIVGVPDAGPPGTPDGPPIGTPDARPPAPDAQPVSITLNETTSSAIVALNSRACANSFGVTAENSYYRAFRLSDFGINSAFNVTSVSYAVESAAAEVGTSQGVQVRIYNYTGAVGGAALDTASMSQLAGVASTVPDTTGGESVTANLAATVPAGGAFVAEIFVPNSDPDGDTYGNVFYLGSNASGETQPGYIRAPDCGSATPTAFSALGLTVTVDIVMTVTGTYNP
jgi:hypothetical protein